ncbi:AAA family ATPase [Amnibacterium sp.]|uniref:AAA family ATPase n=1 Tax=Amnibacterium sp. TaxID=1872496 RepID=UPI003F7BE61F
MAISARRILVAGAAGAGKTTLAARIAAATGSPHIEIDAVHWRAGWTVNPTFVDDVDALAAGDAWVTEFQYRAVLRLLAERAELLVWVRPRRAVVLTRVLRRTVRRRLRHELVWGTNVEAPLRTILTDRDHIVRWSMRTFHEPEERIREARRANPGLRLVQVRSGRDAARLLAALQSGRDRSIRA